MKQIQFKQILPHIVAIAIFLLVTIIFCKPGLESGVGLKQSDVTSWQGMSHQSLEYRKTHGHLPLWLSNMFSGMPAYQVAMEGDWSPLPYFEKVIQLGLPQPFNFFYLACISFYFLCICLGIRPYAAIIGSLAFAYSSYSPIIVTAGHITKMLALGYAPAVIGAVVLIFDKKYIAGFALTFLLTALQIGQGHQQISYYLFIVIGFMSIAYLINFLRKKEIGHLFKSTSLIGIAVVLGICTNAVLLFTTYDYSKESKRAGMLVMDKNENNKSDKVENDKTVGLNKDYAFMWSYGVGETWTLMFPGAMGYGSHQAERDGDVYIYPTIPNNGHLVKYLNDNVPQFPVDQVTNQMNGAIYWGNQPFTNGPVYFGAIICFLFVLGMFYLDNKHKWWILFASVLAIMLSWGENFPAFNYFMFDYFPFYNKFRVPTMILVVPQLLFPIIAALTLNKLMADEDVDAWKKFKSASIATAALFAMVSFYYFSNDFSKENKTRTAAFNQIVQSGGADVQNKIQSLDKQYKAEIDNQIYEGMVGNFSRDPNLNATKTSREFVSALRKDRASFLLNDILRSLIFILLAVTLIALYLKKRINMTIMVIGITVFSSFDLIQFGMHYLNDKSFENKEDHEAAEFPISTADKMILADTDPNFRVINTSSVEESKTSYYHKSVGGYHPAKLGIYDDLIAYQFKGNFNMAVINMLNTKYFIQPTDNDKIAQLNPGAMGNVWFVKGVKFVKGAANEMRAISNFNPKDTAVVDESFKAMITNYVPADSNSFIKQTAFDNDTIHYSSNATNNQIAVFSEIYYKDWHAYIDGKPAPIFKTNYVLRGLQIPAGKHDIVFIFEPASFYLGKKVASTSMILLLLIVFGSIGWYFVKSKNESKLRAA